MFDRKSGCWHVNDRKPGRSIVYINTTEAAGMQVLQFQERKGFGIKVQTKELSQQVDFPKGGIADTLGRVLLLQTVQKEN